jgi:hypothetical protein
MVISSPPKPVTYLDCAIVRLALTKARKAVAEGLSPNDAAAAACTGAWSEWREYVYFHIVERGDVSHQKTNWATDKEATSGSYAAL